jgi:hypothetical protein
MINIGGWNAESKKQLLGARRSAVEYFYSCRLMLNSSPLSEKSLSAPVSLLALAVASVRWHHICHIIVAAHVVEHFHSTARHLIATDLAG